MDVLPRPPGPDRVVDRLAVLERGHRADRVAEGRDQRLHVDGGREEAPECGRVLQHRVGDLLALARHGDNREPLAVLASLGGFEIAALAGAFIGCAARGIPVLVDGFIVTVAALAAVRLRPELRDWLLFAHHSREPGHTRLLSALDAEPVLNLSMRLGEGSGAAVAVPVIRSACALHNGMATFADAGVASSQ